MVSLNRILTKMNFTEMLDYSSFSAEPQKVIQKGLMQVGETGVKILDNFAICINNQPKMDELALNMAYMKQHPLEKQIHLGNNIKRSFNELERDVRNGVSSLYAKNDLLEMVKTNKEYTTSFLSRTQNELLAVSKAKNEYPACHPSDRRFNELTKDYDQKLDAYYREMAQTMMVKDVIQEIINMHKERPLNILARLFGI